MFRKRRGQADFDAEIQAHLDLEEEELREDGLAPEEARATAHRTFGNELAAQERFYESRRWLLWDQLCQDCRYGIRKLIQSPRFTVAVVLTLALGVGANTAIFSAVDSILLRPFPLPDPHQLTSVFSFNKSTGKYVSTSHPDYEKFARQSTSFQHLSAYVRLPLNLTVHESTERVPVEAVTTNYFSMLRLAPLIGRTLGADDEGAPVALISEDLWTLRFRRDPGLLGKSITIEDQSFTVVGVVPRRYRGTNLNWYDPPQIWMPLGATYIVVPSLRELDILRQRDAPFLVMIGRVRPEATVETAQAELQSIAANRAGAEPTASRDLTVMAFPASRAKFWPAYRTVVTQSLLVFVCIAVLVLVLACANVSSLLVERGMARHREIALRLSIGATKGRLMRQLLVESLLLAAPSFLIAVAVAYGLQKLLERFPSALGLGLALDFGVNANMLAFCFVLSVAAIFLCGLAPALRASRTDLLPSLKDSGNAPVSMGGHWLQRPLVIVQIAVSMVLLVGAAAMGRTLLHAYSTDLGFKTDNMLTVSFGLRAESRSTDRGRGLLQDMLSQTAALPGVSSATLSSGLPFQSVRSTTRVATAPQLPDAGIEVNYRATGPDYLHTMGIDLVAGRDFDTRDGATSAKVVMVNQALAQQLWPGEDPVGYTLFLHQGDSPMAAAEIVGLTRNARHSSVWEQPSPYLYLPYTQSTLTERYLIVRTAVDPGSIVPAIRDQWNHLTAREPLLDVRTGDEILRTALAPQRLTASLVSSFGLLAVILVSVGIYGVVACSVERRTREIGIRLAIGASPTTVLRETLTGSLALVAVGVGLGGAISFGLMPLLAFIARSVAPHDVITFTSVALLIAAVSIAAALRPALRASRINPSSALKCE